MYNINKIYKKVLEIINQFVSLRIVTLWRTALLLSISLWVVVFDAMSVISIMPLVDFIRLGQDIEIYNSTTKYGEKLTSAYAFINIPFNLFSLSLMIFVLVMLRQTINLIEIVEGQKTTLRISRDLSFRCFESILFAKADYIRKFKTGQFSVLCERECNEVSLLFRNFLNLSSTLAQLAAYFFVMAYISVISTIISTIIISFLLLTMSTFVKKANIASLDTLNTRKNFYSLLTENFRLWRLFKFSYFNNNETKNISKIANDYAVNQLRIVKYNAMARLLIAILAMAFCIIILNILVKYEQMELTTIAFFALVFVRLVPLGQRLNVFMGGFAKLEPSLSVVCKTLNESNTNAEDFDTGNSFDNNFSEIKFEKVSYKYQDGNHNALKDIDVVIPAKKVTAIVGKSGAGKSTFIDLIPRIIFPTKGNIFIDKLNIKELSLSSLRKNINFIHQESVLSDTTIKENITYFKKDASESEIKEACRLSGVSDFVDSLPGNYNYNVAEGGQKLSGGQKQRVILARVFLSNAKILIMDEATSALDNESESDIRVAIRNMVQAKGKTVIVIAHRKNTIKDADFVAYIKKGRLEATGKPQEIFEKYPNI